VFTADIKGDLGVAMQRILANWEEMEAARLQEQPLEQPLAQALDEKWVAPLELGELAGHSVRVVAKRVFGLNEMCTRVATMVRLAKEESPDGLTRWPGLARLTAAAVFGGLITPGVAAAWQAFEKTLNPEFGRLLADGEWDVLCDVEEAMRVVEEQGEARTAPFLKAAERFCGALEEALRANTAAAAAAKADPTHRPGPKPTVRARCSRWGAWPPTSSPQ
jgi:hypothetical protein